jgi:SsrA-binding protein
MQRKVICQNRKAWFDYEVLETLEAGIALKGSEVKSLAMGQASIRDAYAEVRDGEVFLVGSNIARYAGASIANHDPNRARKLLLNAKEIKRLQSKVVEKGLTLVPLSMYFNERGKAKVELALCRGRRKYDKRERIMKRDEARARREGL